VTAGPSWKVTPFATPADGHRTAGRFLPTSAHMVTMTTPLDPTGLTLVTSLSGSDAVLFDGEARIDFGHTEDVMERLIERLGVTVEYNREIIVDSDARGWDGVAKTLSEVQ
jgi:hypothetical protein